MQANTSAITNGSINTITTTYGADGRYLWSVQCFDSSSLNNFSINRTFNIDSVNPSPTIFSPTSTTYNTVNLSLNYTASDTNLNTTWYQYNGTNTTITSNTTFTSLEGASTLYLYANDSAGNINSTSVTFTVDSIAPTYTNLALNNTAPKKNETVLFSALWSDSVAGLSHYIFSWNATGSFVNDSAVSLAPNSKIRPSSQTSGTANTTDLNFDDDSTKMTFANGTIYYYNFSVTSSIINNITVGFQMSTTSWNPDYFNIDAYNYSSNSWQNIYTKTVDGISGVLYTSQTVNIASSDFIGSGSIAQIRIYANYTVGSAYVWDVYATIPSGWSNITKTVTANRSQRIDYLIYANDSLGNWNVTTEQNFSVANSPPSASASIIPSPTDGSQPLNCTYLYSDLDSDLENQSWFRWYINDSLLAFTSQNLSNNGNFSNGDNVICSIRVFDGTDNSSWSNSSQLTISDNVVPVLKNDSLSASSGYTNNVMNIFVNLTESNLMDWVYAEITDPNSVVTNYTMTQESHTGTEWRFNRSYTPLVAGTYTFKFHAKDGSGNVGNLTSSLTYVASVYVAPAPAGGGGGSDTVVVTLCGNKLCEYSENEATCPVDCAAKFVVLHPREDARLSKITDNGYQNGVYTSEFRVKNFVEEDLNMTFTSNTSWVKFTIDGYNSVYRYNGILRRKGATDSGISYVRINILANGSVGQVLMGTILISDGYTTTSVPVIFTITDSIGIEEILNNSYVKFMGGFLGIAAVLFFISKKRAI